MVCAGQIDAYPRDQMFELDLCLVHIIPLLML